LDLSKGRYYPKAKGSAGKPKREELLRVIGESFGKVQEILAERTVECSSGGGAVRVVMDGNQKVKSISISQEALDAKDVEMLEDMILAAFNGAVEKSKGLAEELVGEIAGGIGLPGGLGI